MLDDFGFFGGTEIRSVIADSCNFVHTKMGGPALQPRRVQPPKWITTH